MKVEPQLESSLRELQDLKSALNEHAIVAITDPLGRITYVNDQFCAISQYSRAELIGQDHRLVNSGYHPKPFIRTLWHTIAAGHVWKGDLRNRAKDGSLYWVATTIVPILNQDGTPRQYIAIHADITERKRAEAALRESEEVFAKAFRLSPDCVLISRLSDRTVLRANEAMCHFWNSTPDQVIGKPAQDFATWLNETERQAFLQTLLSQQECLHVQAKLRLADGRLLDFDISSRLITHDNEPCVLTILRDITERHRTEAAAAQLAAIVESSHDAIIGKDLNGIITSWNRGAENIFGYSAAEITGTSILRLIPPDRHTEEVLILEKIKRGESVQHFETLRITKTGRLIDVSLTASPIKNQAGKVIGVSKVARDITDQKKAATALRASEQRMRLATEATAVGIWEWNILTDQIRWDPQMFRIYGVQPTPDGTVAYRLWRDRVLPADLPRQEEILQHTVRNLGRSAREFRIRRADDDACRFIQAVETVRTNAQGQAEWVVGTNLDITDRRQVETALQESEERFRTLANTIPQLAWIARADGYITWYNQRWHDYTGTTPEEMEGWGWQSVHDPKELPRVLAAWQAAIAAGHPLDIEFPLRGANGQFRTFLTRVQPFRDATGHIVRWFGTNTDVESLKQAEEKIHRLNNELEQRVIERTAQLETANAELRHSRAELNSLFESLPGLYLVLTPELTIVAVSDAYLTATMTQRENIIGRNLFEVFPDNPADRDASGVSNLRASLNRVWQRGIPDTMAIQKYDVRRPDGVFEERYWSPINSPVFGADRQIKYIVHRVEEVTEFMKQKATLPGTAEELSARVQQMEAEVFRSSQKLQATNQQLEAANAELESFSYSVSHDLRAPLRAMGGYARMIEEDYAALLPEEGRHQLGRIHDNAMKMGQLIDGLLTFSRLSRQTLKKRPLSPDAIVQRVLEELHAEHAGRAVQIIANKLPPCEADPTLLQQIYANLLSNAFKYTRPRNPAVIEIGARQDNPTPVYFVRDNGAGFDMQYANKLFGVFQRLHRADQFEGTGVGLAIVQRIVLRHGGRVWAESQPDQGATFYFTLAGDKHHG